MLISTARSRYEHAWQPLIGAEAVRCYLNFRKALLVGRVIAAVAWMFILVGIGLHQLAVLLIGGALLLTTVYVLWVYGWGQRREAIRLARSHVGLSADQPMLPISGSAQLFGQWLERTRAEQGHE